MPLVSFSSGQVISSANVNANFGLCVLTDTSRTVTVTHTWSASQTFSGGFTTAATATLAGDLLFTDATYDLGKSGATRPRDGFFSRNVAIGGTVAVTGAATLSSTLGVSAVTTVTVARTSGTNSNALVLSDNVTGSQTTAFGTRIVGSSNAGGAISVIGFEAGGAGTNNESQIGFYTQNAGSSLTSQVTIMSTGELRLNPAVSRLVPGATSFSARNNANTQDNLKIDDTGNITTRSTGSFTSNGGTYLAGAPTAAASLPAASVATVGLVAFDTTNNRIVWYPSSSTRFYAAGTAF